MPASNMVHSKFLKFRYNFDTHGTPQADIDLVVHVAKGVFMQVNYRAGDSLQLVMPLHISNKAHSKAATKMHAENLGLS